MGSKSKGQPLAGKASPGRRRSTLMESGVIRFNKVSFAYESEEPVLQNISLKIGSGLNLLVGPNGCGKSTLLKIAAGVEKPDSGQVFIDNFNLWKEEVKARQNIAYLPEQPDLTPYASIREIINLVCRLRGESLDWGKEALEFFDLNQVSSRTVRELSMGQRRKAVFAACLVGRPKYILLDEPLEGMDVGIQKEILYWISQRIQEGALVLVVSHSFKPFVKIVTQAMTVREGSAYLYKKLPSSTREKSAFLEKLAQGMPPK